MTDNKTFPLIAIVIAQLIGGLGNTLLATNPQDPWLFLSIRYLFGALILVYWLPQIFKLPKRIKLAALFDTLSVITIVLGLSTVSVALATVVGTLAPLIALFANKVTGRQSIPRLIFIPITLGAIGVICIASQKSFNIDSLMGIMLVILSIAFGSVGAIINGWHGDALSMWSRVNLTNTIGAVALLPILIINLATPTATHPTWSMITTAFIVALLPGTLAKGLSLYALKHISVPVVLQASTLAVISAAVSAWLILGQSLNYIAIIGVALGIASITSLTIITLKQK